MLEIFGLVLFVAVCIILANQIQLLSPIRFLYTNFDIRIGAAVGNIRVYTRFFVVYSLHMTTRACLKTSCFGERTGVLHPITTETYVVNSLKYALQ